MLLRDLTAKANFGLTQTSRSINLIIRPGSISMTSSLSTKIPQETAKLALKQVFKALKTTFTCLRLYCSYVSFLFLSKTHAVKL